MKASRLYALTLAAGTLLVYTESATGPRLQAASARTPPSRPAATALLGERWAELDRLVGEQKYEAASAVVAEIRAQAQSGGHEMDWTRAIVREVQLRTALHGYETSVRFLRETPWPPGTVARVVLDAFYAQSLVHYLRTYSWEIHQRERVETKGPLDLKKWTADEIGAEAERTYTGLWAQRTALGEEPVGRIGEYLTTGTYPEHVRGRLRDLITYLYVQLLADTSHWRPADNELYRLNLETLLGTPPATVGDRAAHPLSKIAAILTDLEEWHTSAARREAALEARLERLRRLHASFTNGGDRRRIREDLERRAPAFRDVAWWSVSQAVLADFVEADNSPDALVRARKIAMAGAAAYPESLGATLCESTVAAIESPEFGLTAMTLDGPRRRSVQVDHKNLARLFFRAYAFDLTERLRTGRDYNLLPAWNEVPKLIAGARPAVEWTAELPPTPDYRSHRTFVTPPLDVPGLYIVVASARDDFQPIGGTNKVQAVNLLVSDLVLVHRTIGDAFEVTATSGRTGQPVAGASVELWQLDWQKGHHLRATRTTGAEGIARFDRGASGALTATREWELGATVALLARHGRDLSLDARVHWNVVPAPEVRRSSLVYTDRSVYRPQQKLLWKVVAYEGGGEESRFHTSPHAEVEVQLIDANGDTVETKAVVTNEFGSAAGELVIPAGRRLGPWAVRTSLGGEASVRVEEYKRPTFEVTLLDPEHESRLNEKATLTGTARYYFGLPVTTGRVAWRVTRHAVRPWWWFCCGGFDGASRVVAAGESVLGEDGRFTLTFTPEADAGASRELSWTYAVGADVTDEGGETRSATRSFRLGFVSVETRIGEAPGFVLAGQTSTLGLSRTDLDGTPRAGAASWTLVALSQPAHTSSPADQPVTLEAGRAARDYRTPGDDQRPRNAPQYVPAEVLRRWVDGASVDRGTLTHDAKGEATLTLPRMAAGAYRLRYETKDAAGSVFRMSHEIVVAQRNGTPLALPGLLAVERPLVRVGGTARLLVHSGFADQPMTLEIWREGRRADVRHLIAGRAADIVELPISEKDRGGFGVTLTLVRDHQIIRETASVFVPWDDRALKVAFSTFRDTLRPGSRETWRITVTGADPQREPTASAEVLASMYDRSLDVFAPHYPLDARSIYPSRNGAGAIAANLDGAGAAWSEGWLVMHGRARLHADGLDFWRGYGVGGPGLRDIWARNGMAGGMLGGVVGEVAESVVVSGMDARELPLNGRSFEQLSVLAEVDRTSLDAPPAPAEPVPVRSNFSETAFWEPQLLTGPKGEATFEFTVPDSVTSWKLWASAITRDLRGGTTTGEARSVKDLMVRPYLPRFLREGDRAEIKVVVNNASKTSLSGVLDFDILDPETDASVRAEFGVDGRRSLTFTVAPGGSADVTVPIVAPKRVGAVAVKVVARAGDLSDGEQRLLPLLPSRLNLVESRFATVKGVSARTLAFPALARTDDPSRQTDRLVVTLDGQLFYGVLQALPYLVNYPYECTEQTLNRFVSTGIVRSLFDRYPAIGKMAAEMAQRDTRLEPWDREDPNRRLQLEEMPWAAAARGGREHEADLIRVLDPKIAEATRAESLAKLAKSQTSLGAFPWWPGGPPSPYMTLYAVSGFSHAREFGVDVPKEMVKRAFAYLHRHYLDDWVRARLACDCGWELVTFLGYVLTSYPDDSWTGGVFTKVERQEMLDFSFRHWKDHAPYLKGQLALTLQRSGRPEDARLVWDSVMDSAKTDADTGTSWAPEDRAWLWYNDTIETHAFALRTLAELRPRDPRREGLVQWLFLNKKLNHWSSTRSTAEVVYALAHYLKQEGQLGAREEATVTAGSQTRTFAFEPDVYAGKAQLVVPGATVDAEHVSQVVVEKTTPGMLFASATWHYATDRLPDEDAGDVFAVARRYFRRENRGGTWTLVPIGSDTVVAPGDEVEVQLSLRAKHAAEYVHLRDPRGAGFEPVTLISGFKWQTGLGFYEEVRDSGENFFFEWLPVGEYTFRYRLRAATAGTFRVGPAEVQSMYAPEFVARSSGVVLQVSPARAAE